MTLGEARGKRREKGGEVTVNVSLLSRPDGLSCTCTRAGAVPRTKASRPTTVDRKARRKQKTVTKKGGKKKLKKEKGVAAVSCLHGQSVCRVPSGA